ncbi:nuclear transport factor 2 family protein [Flavobacterium sp.]|jgi:hypothetical protein|uniref:nuclear transport factor 2 family protein n=1 Tax=Flavobacterium TaxID=237 RepID=UPI0022C64A65|nr:nuclear transport factor 2 family protein [Flavobacterium sp.]MCZ8090882.1 nuclear transport factor 2 family protein [Flavobacterium sp.]
MKKYLFIILLFISFISNAQKKEVQKTIETFFEGFHKKDSLFMKKVCVNNLILQTINEGEKGNELINETPNEFFISIATIPSDMKIEERILSYNIQVDGAMAHAWTPYEFYVNGKLSHKGVNAFTLFLDGKSWKIIHLIDTRRK